MTDTPMDAQTLKDLPQGAMETLLNTARAETGAAVAFVALYRADGSFAITTSMEEDVPWEGRSLASLARSIWLDPDLAVGKVLVSSARVEGGRRKRRQAHVASVVLSDAAVSDLEWGLLSIIAQNDHKFPEDQLERIGALSKNLAAYLSARERMIDDLMDAVQDEGNEPTTSPSIGDEGDTDLEEIFIETVRAAEPVAPSDAGDEAIADIGTPITGPDREEVAGTPRERAVDAAMRSDVDDFSTRAGSNGVRDTAPRTVREEHHDEIHVILPRPPDVAHAPDTGPDGAPTEDDAGETLPADAAEPLVPELTLNVVQPGLVDHIADAMDAIGDGVETVALIHLKITYDDTASIVPTEAARVLVAKAIKNSVRYDDKVARVGENSFVFVARQRPGSPDPAAIQKRLVKAARKATGWTDAGPTFRTDCLVIDADSIDDPEDVLISLLHP